MTMLFYFFLLAGAASVAHGGRSSSWSSNSRIINQRNLLQEFNCTLPETYFQNYVFFQPAYSSEECGKVGPGNATVNTCSPCLCSLYLGFALAFDDPAVVTDPRFANSGSNPSGFLELLRSVLQDCINTNSARFPNADQAEAGLLSCTNDINNLAFFSAGNSACVAFIDRLSNLTAPPIGVDSPDFPPFNIDSPDASPQAVDSPEPALSPEPLEPVVVDSPTSSPPVVIISPFRPPQPSVNITSSPDAVVESPAPETSAATESPASVETSSSESPALVETSTVGEISPVSGQSPIPVDAGLSSPPIVTGIAPSPAVNVTGNNSRSVNTTGTPTSAAMMTSSVSGQVVALIVMSITSAVLLTTSVAA